MDWKKLCAATLVLTIGLSAVHSEEPPLKQHSAFYPKERLAKVPTNVRKTKWSSDLADNIVSNAAPWMSESDDALWDSMFGPRISRSWMVWSNGHCPACKKSVEMYNWKMDAWNHPWKVCCPNCNEYFPKNDFHAFYRSGLDEHGVFDPKLGDRKLLFNADHPDPKDPLHMFGVDDGEGYVEGANRWRFIGTYLIFGQFHQRILSGIDTLSAAYVVTGDSKYAHKAGILLDRIADVYPTFDFMQQGYVYEIKQANGYISVWHDTSEETYEMTIAYDQVFEGLREDKALVDFLSVKAKQYKLTNTKTNFAEIQRNIEGRILRDALAHPEKIHSNFPRRECTEAMIYTVLGWPENRALVEKRIDTLVAAATAVDGLTGEKGLANYSAYTIAAMARFLNEYVRVDPTFLPALLKRNPNLRSTYKFHIDTHCLGNYYPLSGDTGSFGKPMPDNPVMLFSTFGRGAALRSPLGPSMYSLFWQLYKETGDPAYVQEVYVRNKKTLTDLPYDVFENDPRGVQKEMQKVIRKHGDEPKVGSINKQQWHLSILRSGKDENRRALWLDYDAGGAHGHLDGMNLGLFAYGLDLLPEFGYPPVQFGGWTTPKATWYRMTAAHNTVVVDGQNDRDAAGQTTLWADGETFHAIRASAPGLTGAKQFERTAALIDISPDAFYVLDVFRVVGGSDHAKFTHSLTGTISTDAVTTTNTIEYGHGTQTRQFRQGLSTNAFWSATWQIQDRYKAGSKGKAVQMRYTDLTDVTQVLVGETWVVGGQYGNTTDSDQLWIPCLISRRQGTALLSSTFVSVLEPFSGESAIQQIRRLPLEANGAPSGPDNVAIEITLKNGMRDLYIERNREATPAVTLKQPDWNVTLDGEVCWLRRSRRGKLERVVLSKAQAIQIADKTLKATNDFREFRP
jgi:hypothetical protein